MWEAVYICQGQSDYEPEGRYRHEVAFDGKNIYILGGGTADEVFDFFDIPMFNVDTKCWHRVKTKRDTKCKYFIKLIIHYIIVYSKIYLLLILLNN